MMALDTNTRLEIRDAYSGEVLEELRSTDLDIWALYETHGEVKVYDKTDQGRYIGTILQRLGERVELVKEGK